MSGRKMPPLLTQKTKGRDQRNNGKGERRRQKEKTSPLKGGSMSIHDNPLPGLYVGAIFLDGLLRDVISLLG